MDILVSAIVGDLVSRSASVLIGNYFRQQPGIDEALQRLQRVVPRIDTVVEEAEGRHITNQGMLRQLQTLRQEMYRGHYVLDALRFQPALEDDKEVRHSSMAAALSKSCTASPAKRLRFSGGEPSMFGTNRNIREELQRMVDGLEDTMDAGMKEFLTFLASYPRRVVLGRQPYCAHLLLENCMFGRQTERERVLDFLLRPSATSAAPSLPVLPIVGPFRVGKSTLVEHVCRDESVRDHFSTIIFFPQGSIKDEGVIGSFQVRHQKNSAPPSNGSRLLAIVEITGDIKEGTWRSLKSSVTSMTPCGGGGSKIIVTSRSNRIVNLGTTEALRLHGLPPDAYWHLFKSLAFGSTDTEEHPNLAAMAMEIASQPRHCQCLMSAHMFARLLRDSNLDAGLWRTILEYVRALRKAHAERPNRSSLREDEPQTAYQWRCRYFSIREHHQSDPGEEVPKISVRDVILGCGGRLPRGEFRALALRSCIPPYYNYTVTCIMPAPQPTAGGKKRVIHPEEGHLV